MRIFKRGGRVLSLLLILAQGLCGLPAARAEAVSPPMLGVFSWDKREASNRKRRAALLETLSGLGAGEVYQALDSRSAPAFIREAQGLGLEVWLLEGRPEWGLDEKAGEIKKIIRRVAGLRGKKDAVPAGLMLDVEPYLTSAWNRDPARAMDSFASAMKTAYAYVREKQVPLLLCIPYFYDTLGYEEQLRQLILEGCDGVAVMNYRKADEAGQMETELALAREAGKRLINIYELQRPGTHDLTEANTYWQEGPEGVRQSIAALRERFGDEGLSFALHDYTAILDRLR